MGLQTLIKQKGPVVSLPNLFEIIIKIIKLEFLERTEFII